MVLKRGDQEWVIEDYTTSCPAKNILGKEQAWTAHRKHYKNLQLRTVPTRATAATAALLKPWMDYVV